MKAIVAIVLLGLIACAAAQIISPYYGGYYSAPVVSRVGYASPYVSSYSSYVSPYVSSYYTGVPVAARVGYAGVYSPYSAYSYLLKK